MNANVIASAVQLGDRPHLDRLVGPAKVLLDKYMAGTIDEVHVYFTTFINTMKQESRHGTMLPIPQEFRTPGAGEIFRPDTQAGSWDYIYEPDAKQLLDAMLRRYVEALIFQMVNENMASEQSARMVAMKAASDNAQDIIEELQLIYNKSRQASITKELAEIVGGAAAV
jgi:F-type H+-transporting ATPase subunit gamma